MHHIQDLEYCNLYLDSHKINNDTIRLHSNAPILPIRYAGLILGSRFNDCLFWRRILMMIFIIIN